MAETRVIEKDETPKSPNESEQDAHSRLLLEAQASGQDKANQTAEKFAGEKTSADSLKNPGEKSDSISITLPPLDLIDKAKEAAKPPEARADRSVLPWTDKGPDGVLRQHMSYGSAKDAIVYLGEGPFHVAKRLLGPSAKDVDVKNLTKALTEQYKEETKDTDLSSLRNGHSLLNERNIGNVISKIRDGDSRQRITDALKEGWCENEPPVAVPMEAHGRPGETHPSKIENPEQFLKDMTAAMVRVKADEYWQKGLCAAGFRLAINELPLWRIDGGSIDVSINKDIRGWRSGVQMALDLAATGLFDVVQLKELGYQNLKQGMILGRWHYPDYVKNRPSWGGEDFGDIDVWTPRHKPANDSAGPNGYRDTFVLIPKGMKR